MNASLGGERKSEFEALRANDSWPDSNRYSPSSAFRWQRAGVTALSGG
jgi:hypothetical protein